MIDTLGVWFLIPISKAVLESWGFERHPKGKYFNMHYRLNISVGNGAVVTFTYLPYSYLRAPMLNLEFSLPHLLVGNNIHLVSNIEQAVAQANECLPKVEGIPVLNLWDGVLYRLDVCYDHKVGDLVPFYIQALQALEYSRRSTLPYTSQGVQYKNQQVTTKFYDKHKESGNPAALGILRQETSLRKVAIKKLTGLKRPTLRDITMDLTLDALEDNLRALNLSGRSIGTYDTSLQTLCDAYGTDAGFCYFGALAAIVEYPSRDVVTSASGIHPRALDRRLKKVINAGLPLTLTRNKQPLPPLVIERPDDNVSSAKASVIK